MKAGAFEVAEYFGLDLGPVMRAFYSQMIRGHAIPLNLRSFQQNDDSRRAIAETDTAIASGDNELYDDVASLLAADEL